MTRGRSLVMYSAQKGQIYSDLRSKIDFLIITGLDVVEAKEAENDENGGVTAPTSFTRLRGVES